MTPSGWDIAEAETAPQPPPTATPGALTVVFIHGFLDEGGLWANVATALAATGVSVVAPDLPGMGARNRDAGPFSLDRLTLDLLDVVDRLEGPIVLVGHSMGAQVAELVANERPDRVAALVLLTPVPLGGMELPAEVASTLRGLGGNPEAHRDVRRQLAGPFAQCVLEDLVAVGRKVREDVVAALFDAWAAGDAVGHAETAVRCPVLLIGGAKDPFVTPELLESVVGPRFPGATTIFVADAGHWPHVERPDATASIVATFLAGLNETAP